MNLLYRRVRPRKLGISKIIVIFLTIGIFPGSPSLHAAPPDFSQNTSKKLSKFARKHFSRFYQLFSVNRTMPDPLGRKDIGSPAPNQSDFCALNRVLKTGSANPVNMVSLGKDVAQIARAEEGSEENEANALKQLRFDLQRKPFSSLKLTPDQMDAISFIVEDKIFHSDPEFPFQGGSISIGGDEIRITDLRDPVTKKMQILFEFPSRKIGKGSFKRVTEGFVYPPLESAISAQLRSEVAKNPNAQRDFLQEGEFLKKIQTLPPEKSRGFVKTYMVEPTKIVQEKLDGDLYKLLYNNRSKLTKTNGLELAQEICEAIGTLHEMGYNHNDIKPENILYRTGKDGKVEAKISDFGLAFKQENASQMADGEFGGTPIYMAPELSYYDPKYGTPGMKDKTPAQVRKADVFAVGATLYQVFNQRRPPWFYICKPRNPYYCCSKTVNLNQCKSDWIAKMNHDVLIQNPNDLPTRLALRAMDPNPETRISLAQLKNALNYLKEQQEHPAQNNEGGRSRSLTEVDRDTISKLGYLSAPSAKLLTGRNSYELIFNPATQELDLAYLNAQHQPTLHPLEVQDPSDHLAVLNAVKKKIEFLQAIGDISGTKR